MPSRVKYRCVAIEQIPSGYRVGVSSLDSPNEIIWLTTHNDTIHSLEVGRLYHLDVTLTAVEMTQAAAY